MKIIVLFEAQVWKEDSSNCPFSLFSHFFCGLFGLFFLLLIYLFILVGIFGLFYFLTWDNALVMMIIMLPTQYLEQ